MYTDRAKINILKAKNKLCEQGCKYFEAKFEDQFFENKKLIKKIEYYESYDRNNYLNNIPLVARLEIERLEKELNNFRNLYFRSSKNEYDLEKKVKKMEEQLDYERKERFHLIDTLKYHAQ